ncbi:MAG: hypothetical protein JWO12_2849, partial [Frankiales bacterium]|nr:hypothetical protein [Frankiales bacterium]
DRLELYPGVLDAVRTRAELTPATFRLLVTNPARAEFHLLHPERHAALENAKPALERLLDQLTMVAGGGVNGEVSIRHDSFQAVEEDLLVHPADELLVAVHEHDLARRLHHDLPRRLERLHLPVMQLSG